MKPATVDRPRLEGTRFVLRGIAIVLAAGLFVALALVYPSAGDPGPYLSGNDDRLPAVAELEREWLAAGLASHYVPSPVASLPCPTGPTKIREALAPAIDRVRAGDDGAAIDLLSPLARAHPAVAYALGTLLYRNRQVSQADLVMSAFLELDSTRRIVRRSLDAAAANQRASAVSADDLRALVYLMQAQAVLQLEQGRTDAALWDSIKNPIGLSKQLLLLGVIGAPIEDTPTWAQAQILPPGCTEAEQPLSTYDLYNNLIVAYMHDPNFRDERRRERELARDYDDAVDSNPLLAVLRANTDRGAVAATPDGDELGAMGEPMLWAVSNAERLLRFSVLPPRDPLLAANLATLIDDSLPFAPTAALVPLRRQRSALVEAAIANRERVARGARSGFARTLTRLALIEAIEGGKPLELPLLAEAELEGSAADTVSRLQKALALRTDTDRVSELQSRGGRRRVHSSLGEGSTAWLSALRTDLAAAVARRSSVLDGRQRDRLRGALAARSLLRFGDRIPEALREHERSLGWRRTLSPGWVFWLWLAVAAAAAVWIGRRGLRLAGRLHQLLIQRRELFRSLYQLEARELERRRRLR